VGKVFFTESQFYAARDASKLGFAVLNRHLHAWGYAVNDGKHVTPYLASCGFGPLTRGEFSAITRQYTAEPGHVGKWEVDAALLGPDWEPATVAGMRRKDVLPNGSSCRWTTAEMVDEHRSNNW
jgi:hypothetical protein